MTTTIANPTLNGEFVSDFVEFCAARDADPEMALTFLNTQDWSAGKDDYEPSPAEVAVREAGMKEFCRQMTEIELDHAPSQDEIGALLNSAMAPLMQMRTERKGSAV